MSFDGENASSLEIGGGFVSSTETSPPRRPRRRASIVVSSSALEQGLSLLPAAQSASTLDAMMPCEVHIEPGAKAWMARTRSGLQLQLVAQTFAAHLGVGALFVRHEAETQDPNVERVYVVARVPSSSMEMLDKLFDFVSTPWWQTVVRGMNGAVLVDVEFL